MTRESITDTATPSPAGVSAEQAETPAAQVIGEGERRTILWLANASHLVNHFQNQMVAALYPVIMAEMGFSYAQLGVISGVQSLVGSWTQVGYGLVTPFFHRVKLLGFGNVLMALGTLITGFSNSFLTFLLTRSFVSIAGSPQHPVGASLISSYFPKTRGAMLALNSSVSFIGSLAAPALVGIMLLFLDWRIVFYLVGAIGLVVGTGFFFFPDRLRAPHDPTTTRKEKLAQGLASYLRVLRNRNMMLIALVMMSGAAGRGGGVNQAYLGVHFVNDLGLGVALGGIALSTVQVGGVVGPVAFGWISDRLSRKWVIQTSLLCSALTSVWLAWQGPNLPVLFLCLLIYGIFTYSRGTLTQAIVADSVKDEDRDAAYSLYFFIGFLSAPIWTFIAGVLMDIYGFSLAFSVLSVTYLFGIILMSFVDDRRPVVI